MDTDRFKGQTNAEIVKAIGKEQKALLREFLGSGPNGAKARAQNFRIPAALTRETLERYGEIARRQIVNNNDPLGTQAERLKLVERALQALQ